MENGSRTSSYFNDNPNKPINIKKFCFLELLILNVSKFLFNKIYILATCKDVSIYKKFNNKTYNLSKIEVVVEKSPFVTSKALYSLKDKIKKNFFLLYSDRLFDINFFELSRTIDNHSLGVIACYKKSKYLKTAYNNGGIYFLKRKIFKCIPNKKVSLKNKILPNFIKKKSFKIKFFNNFFLNLQSSYPLHKTQKKLKSFFYRPALFLDRDGTINRDKGYTYKISDLKFMPKIIEVLKKYSKKNYYFFIVTNQSGIAKKKYSLNSFFKFQKYLISKLLDKRIYINDFQYCPHHPESLIKKYRTKCQCRKPNNLMIKTLVKRWPVIKKGSVFIGNNYSDYLAAKKTNIKFINYSDITNIV